MAAPGVGSAHPVRKSWRYLYYLFKGEITKFRLFSRDRSIGECILCIILAIIVSIVGIHVLYNDVYYDLEILVYCCVIAASQYSLLKSCQPDVNTPVHV